MSLCYTTMYILLIITISILPINIFNNVTMATDESYLSSIFEFVEIAQFCPVIIPKGNHLKRKLG